MSDSLNNLFRRVATLGFIGYMPAAPGTFGSLAALGFAYLMRHHPNGLAVSALLVIPLGVFCCGRAEGSLGKDASHIVIDEFAGYLVAVLFLPLSAGYLVAAFVLFRALDISKPPPVKVFERVFGGGVGVMADDVAAGVYTNLILQAWRFLH